MLFGQSSGLDAEAGRGIKCSENTFVEFGERRN